jgi:hypothetical protein
VNLVRPKLEKCQGIKEEETDTRYIWRLTDDEARETG